MRTVETVAGLIMAAIVLAYLTSPRGPELIKEIASGVATFTRTLLPSRV
jgi:hypothetical protein